MSTFSAKTKANPKPPRVVVLTPDAFADTWPERPSADVAVGLRRISEQDIQAARNEATKQVVAWYADNEGVCIDEDARNEAFNDALLRFAVARAACDPNDSTKTYFEFAEETVREALTSQGARRLWDELVQLHIASNVSLPLATDDEARVLGRLLRLGACQRLPGGTQGEVRKLLMHCLMAIAEAAPDLLDREEQDDDEEEVSVYHAVAS